MPKQIEEFLGPKNPKGFCGGADNQQERPSPDWVVGFVDGEGCFHVAINHQPKMTIGWQVLPEFRVVQHQRDNTVLQKLVAVFECGSVVRNHGDRNEFRVRGLKNLKNVVHFFHKHPLQTTKQENFVAFSEVVAMMDKGLHKTKKGLVKIANIAWRMNRQVKPRFLESSETVCQTPLCEDTVRPAQRCAETSRNV